MAKVLELETKLVTSEITYAVHAMRAAVSWSYHVHFLARALHIRLCYQNNTSDAECSLQVATWRTVSLLAHIFPTRLLLTDLF